MDSREILMRRRAKLVFLIGIATALVIAVFTLRYVLSPSVTLQGRVSFKGVPPSAVSFSLPDDPQRARLLDDGSFVLGSNGSLANVLVYIKDDVAWDSGVHANQVRVERRNCLFTPRVFGVRVGCSIELVNLDPWVHNAHCNDSKPPFNLATTANTISITKPFTIAQVPVQMRCDIHAWERAFAGVFTHPYFAVTRPDGTFSFPAKLRPGVYTIVAWHERLGMREQRIFCFWPTKTILFTLER